MTSNAHEEFTDCWIKPFTEELKGAWPDEVTAKAIIKKWVLKALEEKRGPMEIADYFHISYPGIIDNAIEADSDKESVSLIFDEVMEAAITSP